MTADRVYRSLLRLYPRAFRQAYGDDLVQHLDDLTADLGRRRALVRVAGDLTVTVPRYQLENLMTERRSSTALNAFIIILAVAGVLSVLVGLYPGVVLLLAAAVLFVSQRTAIARAIRRPDTSRRRRRLTIAAVLGVVFALSVMSFGMDTSDEHISDTSLMLHNVIGTPAMVGALAFLVIGLLTPKQPAASHA